MTRRTSPCAAVWLLALPAIFACACPATAATYTVTNTDDSGAGSLRQAISDANGNSGTDTIAFNLTGTGPFVITVHSPMVIASGEPVFMDGYSQPGARVNTLTVGSDASLQIVLDGANEDNGDDDYGLYVMASGCAIRGLVFRRFKKGGIHLDQNTSTGKIYGCFFGTDADGATLKANGLSSVSIYNSSGNTIGGDTAAERNVICGGAGQAGINISGADATDNLIAGNYIGTDADGTAALGNYEGILISGAPSTTIGGTTAAERNVISGNNSNGVRIAGSGVTGTVVSGNYIGTNAAGSSDLGNTFSGVLVENAPANTIGGSTAGARNVISGNNQAGVWLYNAATTGNLVRGNYIGTDATGTADVGNTQYGVVTDGAPSNTIGGATAGERNVISGNDQQGVYLYGAGSTGNLVHGNYIGTDVNGTADLGNTQHGVYVNGAPSNTIGGTTAGARNVISGNNQYGVCLTGSGATANTVSGNYIGTNAAGTADLGNTVHGVTIDGAPSNTVGGTTTGQRNVISGNDSAGIWVNGSGATGNVIRGNHLGTDVNGTAGLGNASDGVLLNNAPGNTIGGTSAGERNIISGNTYGVRLQNSGTSGNLVAGNYIGTDVNGTADLGNSQHGVGLFGAPTNTIGGATSYQRNVISGNDQLGVFLSGASSTGNVILGNYIGVDANGTTDLGNAQQGIYLYAAPANTIGGTTSADRNVISGNDQSAVYLTGAGSIGNVVSGNYLGTNAAGSGAVPNNGSGVYLRDAPSNTIGGTTAGERNVLSGNNSSGVILYGSGTTGNVVEGNYIGTNAAGTADLGNTRYGLDINTAQNNTIGGDTAAKRNIISGNNLSGVILFGSSTTGNVIAGNYIGTDVNGTADLGNTGNGVVIENAPSNTIGGDTGGERNVISGNNLYGVQLVNTSASGNVVSGNYIGTDTTGTADLGNTEAGVFLNNAPSNTIGGATAGERNVISGNNQSGVLLLSAGATGNQLLGNCIGTNATGAAALGNTTYGICLNAAPSNTIGGTSAGARNVISGNGSHGVYLTLAGATGNAVFGNYIGTDKDGATALGNLGVGVLIDGSPNTIIGGTGAGERNVISANQLSGIFLNGSGATGTTIAGNYLGTDATGAAGLGNIQTGVTINGSPNNTVGRGNVISDNGINGIHLQSSGATGNHVEGNFIGTNAGGTADLGNTTYGVLIDNAPGNTIGGTTAGQRNVIAGNDSWEVDLQGAASSGNVVSGNYIGTDVNGSTDQTTAVVGVGLSDAPNNTIGGTTANSGNVISGSNYYGVTIGGSGASGNLIAGNYVGTNASGTAAVGNANAGVQIAGGTANTVGGTTDLARNVISGNDQQGVALASAGNFVQGNYIGTASDGTSALGNGSDGVRLAAAANTIGGQAAGAGNRIAHNSGAGVKVTGASTTNALLRNLIWNNGGLGIDLAGGTEDANQVTANDSGDSDSGPNNLMNFPVITSAITSGSTTVSGTLDSGATGPITVALYQNDSADPSGYGEGQTWLGEATVSSGSWSATVAEVPVGKSITATATDGSGNTSEFSAAVAVTSDPLLVTTTADSGTGSLRAAITYANSHAGADTISFDLPVGDAGYSGGVWTIAPSSALPAITGASTIIDGTTQDGYSSSPLIELNGTNAGASAEGLEINGTTGCQLKALCINRFTLDGIYLNGGSGHTITACRLGTDPAGATDLGNGEYGIKVLQSSGNTIGGAGAAGNLCSGNQQSGIILNGGSSSNNQVLGNFCGTNADGSAALKNDVHGVNVYAAPDNTIGAAGAGNVLSGNGNKGLWMGVASATGNKVQANIIGLKADESDKLPNGLSGIGVFNSAANNTIGGGAGLGNVISGNGLYGVQLGSAAASAAAGNQVIGNRIGLNSDDLALGNSSVGVRFESYSSGNTIGGTAAADRNYIAGNAGSGVQLIGGNATGNVVVGNWIGLDSGGAAKPNTLHGVDVYGSSGNTIGGSAGARNVISGNTQNGVYVHETGATGNQLLGNFVGTNAPGDGAVANGQNGVSVAAGASANTIGLAGAGNVIAGNTQRGIDLDGTGTGANVVRGNLIGVDLAGTNSLGNGWQGIAVWTSSNTIGGTVTGEGNVIGDNGAVNGTDGIVVSGSNATANQIVGNHIGTDAGGTIDLGNSGAGVSFRSGAQENTVSGNVISANTYGVQFLHTDTKHNVVTNNTIGTEQTERADLGNGADGVWLNGPSTQNTIGTGNVIAGNGQNGIRLSNATSQNVIQGNWLGTDGSGTAELPNVNCGIRIETGPTNNTIGGTGTGEGNVIAHGARGVSIIGTGTTGNALRRNTFDDQSVLGIDLGGDGVTANDAEDADTGPNNLQNYPELSGAVTDGSGTQVSGEMVGSTSYPVQVEFFSGDTAAASGHGEAERYEGTVALAAPGTFSANLPAMAVGRILTATATDANGNTSELAGNVTVTGPAARLAFVTNPATVTAGEPISPAVQVEVRDAGGDRVTGDDATQVTISLGSDPNAGSGGSGLSGTLTGTVTDGLVSFSDLSLAKTGTGFALKATAPDLTDGTGTTFDVLPAAAHHLRFSQQPQNTVAGQTMAEVKVEVLDQHENLVTTDSSTQVTLAIGNDPNGGSSALNGTQAQTAVNGVATFGDLSIDQTGTGYTLEATAMELTGATSDVFNIAPAAAHHLRVSQQPTTTVAGQTISAVKVEVLDEHDNLVTTDHATQVMVGLGTDPNGGSSALNGSKMQTAAAGVATFGDLSIDKTGAGFRLAVSATSLTGATSDGFDITPAAAHHLRFSQQPQNTVAGQTMAEVKVEVLDQHGNLLSTDNATQVTLAIGNDPNAGQGGSVLNGTKAQTAKGGVATFGDLSIAKTGAGFTLSASAPPLTGATSDGFNITPSAAHHLRFSQQPQNTVAGQTMPEVKVEVLDQHGNLLSTDNATQVTLAIGNDPNAGQGGSVLDGTKTQTAANGVVTFHDLSIARTGTGFTLAASAPPLAGATSDGFNITPSAAHHLRFSQQPQNTVAGQTMPEVKVEVLDQHGNLLSTDNATQVTLAIGNDPNAGSGGSVLNGTKAQTAVNGVVTFADLSIARTGSGFTLSAGAPSLTGATSDGFNITPAAAHHLRFSQQPQNTVAGQTMAEVKVEVLDQHGNLLSTDNATQVTLAIGNDPNAGQGGSVLNGTKAQTAVNGVVTFADLSIARTGSGFTLAASAPSLTGATSDAFNITSAAAHHLRFSQQPVNTVAGQTMPEVKVEVLDQHGNLLSTDNATQVTLAIGNDPNAGQGGSVLNGTKAQTAANGVVTFHDLSIARTGLGFTLAASATSLTGATSNAFNITSAAAHHLRVSQQPQNTVAGQTLAEVKVELLDQHENLVITDNATQVTLAIGNDPNAGQGGSVLDGTKTRTAVNGVVSFNDLSIARTGLGFTLAASALSLTGATSDGFNITPAAAARVEYVAPPRDTVAGQTLAEVVGRLLDAHGNLVVSDSGTKVTIGLAGEVLAADEGAVLAGTLTQTATAGVVRFADLSLAQAGSYRLALSGTGLSGAVSEPFTVFPDKVAKLAFTVQPTGGVSRQTLAGVEVTAYDRHDNVCTNDSATLVDLALGADPHAAQGGSGLAGTLSEALSAGVAEFADLTIERSGADFTLTATVPEVPAATSEPFEVAAGEAVALAFVGQPTETVAGQAIAPAVTVELLDAAGNRAVGSALAVAITLGPHAGGHTLLGTLTAAPSAGLATFADLVLEKANPKYTLVASAGELPQVSSDEFAVKHAKPTALGFVEQPTETVAGQAVDPAVAVEVLDQYGNRTTKATARVKLTLDGGPASAELFGETDRNSDDGLATFADLSLRKAGREYRLKANAKDLAEAVSDPFTITPAPVDRAHSSLSASPNRLRGNGVEPVTLTTTLRDEFDNPVPGVPADKVTFSSEPAVGPDSGLSLTPPGEPTNADGQTTTSSVRTRPGVVQYTANFEGEALGSPAEVTFIARAVSAEQSTVTVAPERIAADGTERARVTVDLKDAGGVAVEGSPVGDRTITLSAVSRKQGDEPAGKVGAEVVAPGETTGVDGRFVAEVTATEPGEYRIQITVDGTELKPASVTARSYLDLVLSAGMHLVGLPFRPDTDSLAELLSREGVQAATWNAAAGQYLPVTAETAPVKTPGRGMWLKTAQDLSHRLRGEPGPTGPVSVTLEKGWNILANPYLTAQPWVLSSLGVEVTGRQGTLNDEALWSELTPYGWCYEADSASGYALLFERSRPGFSDVEDQLPEFAGLWIRAARAGTTLTFNPATSGKAHRAASEITARDWHVRLTASAAGGSSQVLVGTTARLGRALELETPPPAGEAPSVSLTVVSADGRALAGELRPWRSGREEYELAAVSRTADEVRLAWPSLLRQLPRGVVLELTDRQTERTVLLNTHGGYRYTPSRAGEERRFKLTSRVGNIQRTNITAMTATPTRGRGIALTLVLSGEGEVTLTVRGLGGRLVKQVTQSASAAGQFQMVWDGTDHQGRKVPRGTYVIEATAVSANGAVNRAVRTVTVD